MKRYKYFHMALAAAFMFAGFLCRAQPAAGVDSLLVRALATDELLPLLVDSAIKNSPRVKVSESTAEIARANLRMSKRAIYNALSLSTVYGYGNTVTAGTLLTSGGGTGINNFNTTERATYNMAVGLYLPITQMLNRKDIIQSGKLQVSIAEAEKKNDSLSIRQEVIRLYQALKLSQRLLAVSAKSRQAAQVNYGMSEKNFLQGQATMEQYSDVMERYNRALREYETSLNDFQTNFMLLEAFTGVDLSKLISKVK